LLLPLTSIRLERQAIVLEAPDDCGETVDNGPGIPIKRPQLPINIKRIDQFSLRDRACGQGIKARLQRDGALVELAPRSRLLETGKRCSLQFLACEKLRDGVGDVPGGCRLGGWSFAGGRCLQRPH
jgi:hypothetical protein